MWGFLDYLDQHKFYKLCDHLSNRLILAFDKNPFIVLGLKDTATPEDIKSAFRKLVRQFHPDVNPLGEEKMKEINDAYGKLMENIDKYRSSAEEEKTDYNLDTDLKFPVVDYITKLFTQELFNNMIYLELLNADSKFLNKNKELKDYYRYQTGRIKVSKEKLPSTFSKVYRLREKIGDMLRQVEAQDITPNNWQKGPQNIINIISEDYYYGKTILMINIDILEYLTKID